MPPSGRLPSPAHGISGFFSAAFCQRYWPFLVMIATWAIYWWQVLSGQAVFFNRDLTFYAAPLKTYWLARIRSGEFPFWTPMIGNGMPFFADLSNQVLYPLNIVYLLTPTVAAGNSAYALIHLLLAMVMLYRMVRLNTFGRLSRFNATWAALVYGFSGYVLTVTCNINYLPVVAWGPLALAAFARGLEKGAPQWPLNNGQRVFQCYIQLRDALKYTALLAASIALMILAGDVYDPLVLFIAFAFVLAVGFFKPNPLWVKSGRWRFPLCHWLGGFTFAALLCAVQILPTLTLLGQSVRALPLKFADAMLWSFPPERLIEWIQPFFYGSKYPYPHFIGQFLYPEFREAWADSVYLGLIPVLFAICALLFVPSPSDKACRRGWFWQRGGFLVLIAGVALILAFGRFGFYTPFLLKIIPMLQSQRYPEKLLIWVVIACCALAGLGVQGLQQSGPPRWMVEIWRWPWWTRLLIAVGVFALSAMLFLGLPAEAWIWPHALENSADWGTHFYNRQGHLDGLLAHWSWIVIPIVSLFGLPRRWQKTSFSIWLNALMLMAVADLMFIHVHQIPLMPTRVFKAFERSGEPQALSMMVKDSGLSGSKLNGQVRFFSDQGPVYTENTTYQPLLDLLSPYFGGLPLTESFPLAFQYRVLYQMHHLLPHSGVTHGVRYEMGSFSPLELQNNSKMDTLLGELISGEFAIQPSDVSNTSLSPQAQQRCAAFTARLLALAGVGYVLSPIAPASSLWEAAPQWFIPAAQSPGLNMTLYRLAKVLPRTYLAPEAVRAVTQDEITVLSSAFDNPDDWMRRVALPVQDMSQPDPFTSFRGQAVPAPKATIQIEKQSPEHWQAIISSPFARAYWVVSESYYPSWRATVDGHPMPIELANHRFMAIAIPPGIHRVNLSFQSDNFMVGLLLSLVGGVLLFGFCLPLPKDTLNATF
ncbi:MAG: YfhO family protein [Vampirovibrionales bacterium]|nr:YfhO family protein [Vampirovibrionales bacterium]